MYIELNNIGAIKSGKFFVNGLSVIYGNNGTGKSTIAKVVMAMIKADNIARAKSRTNFTFYNNRINNFDKEVKHLFNFERIVNNGRIKLKDGKVIVYDITIKNGLCRSFDGVEKKDKRKLLDCTYIQTSTIWDWYDFFMVMRDKQKNTKRINNDEVKYPYTLWDLYSKIAEKKIDYEVNQDIIEKIKYYIDGEIIKNGNDRRYYYFNKDKSIVLANTSSNIKVFGVISALLKNSYMTPYGLFIFDEVENGLDEVWQERVADVLPDIVKSGVKIIVNSKNINMVEAIEKFSNEKEIGEKTNFYLANDENIGDIDNSLMKK